MLIETQLPSAPKREDLAAVRRATTLIGRRQAVLVSPQLEIVDGHGVRLCPLPELLQRLDSENCAA